MLSVFSAQIEKKEQNSQCAIDIRSKMVLHQSASPVTVPPSDNGSKSGVGNGFLVASPQTSSRSENGTVEAMKLRQVRENNIFTK